MLVFGNVLPYLSLAAALVLLLVGALATLAWFTRARASRDGRPAETPVAPAATAAHPDPLAAEMRALRDSIEHLVERQQMHTETHRQQVGQKLEAVGYRLDEVGHRVGGLGNELRHEVRRREAELEEIRHQIASIQRVGLAALPAGDSAPAAALPPPSPASDVPPPPYAGESDGEAKGAESSFFLTVSEVPAPAAQRRSIFEAPPSANPSSWRAAPAAAAPAEPAQVPPPEAEADVPDVLGLVRAAFAEPAALPALPEVAAEPLPAEDPVSAAPEAAPAPASARSSIFVPMDDFFGAATPQPVGDEGGWSAAPTPSLFETVSPETLTPVPAPAAEPEAAPEPSQDAPFEDVPPVPEDADDLTVIASIDAATQQALYLAGVTSLDDIAHWGRSDARRIAAEVNVSEETIMHQWIFEAQAALFERYARQPSGF